MPKRKTDQELEDSNEEEEWKGNKDDEDDDEDVEKEDDEVEERNPNVKKGAKKTKKEAAKKSDKESKKGVNSEEDGKIELGANKFVSVRQFKNMTLVDIREFYEDKSTGELKPGKKGIALQVAQWEALKEKMDEISERVDELE